MALETVVNYSQDPFSYYGLKDLYSMSNSFLGYNEDEFDQFLEPSSAVDLEAKESSSRSNDENNPQRKRRRRARSGKNKEELETQRMTHIAVERNRRRQMNDYLTALRSLMPASYVPRSDQASIIGGAINFVKELEQKVRCMESQSNERSGDGDIEVTVVESHANLKIMAKRRPRLLLNIAAGLQTLCLGILHLNVTTLDQMVLFSLSLKIEDGCQLNTVDEIASAVNEMLRRIQGDEPAFT